MFKFLFLILIMIACGSPQESNLDVINGTPTNIPQVVRIVNINAGSACTATIVGPRVLLTAGHCASTGQTVRFRFNGQIRQAVATKSTANDLSLALVSGTLNISPATIGGSVRVGQLVNLVGFGCTQPGGTGGNDGILRAGLSRVVGFSGTDFVTKRGAALCFGDSGGPALVPNSLTVVGVNSRANILDTSFLERMDLQITRNFLKKFSVDNGVRISGI